MAEINAYQAFAEMQSTLPALRKSATNPHFKNKFVPLEEVNGTLLPHLAKHGFAWVAQPTATEHEAIPFGLNYQLVHTATGDVVASGIYPLPSNGTPQNYGSAITYARRYVLLAVTGAVADQDDDGNAASLNVPQPNPQRATTPPAGEYERRVAAATAAIKGTSNLAALQEIWARVEASDLAPNQTLITTRDQQAAQFKESN